MGEFSLSDRLHNGVAGKIAVEHLENQDDFENFKQVCSTWRSETKDIKYIRPSKNTQLPWLMLVDSPTKQYRRFYSLSKHTSRTINLPQFDEDADDNRRYLSSKGWLIAISSNRAIIHFFNVLSCQLIKPPALDIPSISNEKEEQWFEESYLFKLSKFSFSSSPKSSDDDDFEVAMVFDVFRNISFWKPGQLEWIKPNAAFHIRHVQDICFFRGQLYSVDHRSQIMSYDNQTPKRARILANLYPNDGRMYADKYYIVPLQSSLLGISRTYYFGEFEYWTTCFELFEVNVDDGKVTSVEDIGDRALFVGYNSTFFVEASPSDPRGCKPNCIYFTDDCYDQYASEEHHPLGGGSDMGIFCLKEKRKVGEFYRGTPQLNRETPPIWLQLPPY